MGINVRMQNAPKADGIIAAQVNLEKDLKDCMRCKFFYGNNSQCCCCSPGLSQTYSYMLSQTLFEKWVWKNQKYIFNRLTVLLCVFRLVVKAANGVYLALTTSLNTHTLWRRLTN